MNRPFLCDPESRTALRRLAQARERFATNGLAPNRSEDDAVRAWLQYVAETDSPDGGGKDEER